MKDLATLLWSTSRLAYRLRLIPVARALKATNFFLHSNLLPFQARVGRHLRLEHHGLGVVIHPNVVIGDRVQIWQHVTIAAEAAPNSQKFIHIGNDVMIGAAAQVIARSTRELFIGDGARIGAGAVVTDDVSAYTTVIGVPARPLKKGGPA